ncbi:hypothetical protein ACQ86N_14245 [Puia sp. P3]
MLLPLFDHIELRHQVKLQFLHAPGDLPLGLHLEAGQFLLGTERILFH